MHKQNSMKQYTIAISPEGTSDWYNINGITMEGAQAIDGYVKEHYPLGIYDLRKIQTMLETYIENGKDYVFGITIGEQNEIEGRLLIVQMNSEQFVKEIEKKPKEQVWDYVMDQGLEAKNEKVFDKMIRENIDRIEFVRDGVGLRDFVFLAQKDVDGFVNNVFAVLDIDVEPTDDYETKIAKHNENIETRELFVLKKMDEIFKNTNRKIFVGVGFEENLQLDPALQMKRAFGIPTSGEHIQLEEARARIFPSWYKQTAKMPDEVHFVTKKAEKYIKEYLSENDLAVLKKELKKMKQHNIIKMIEEI